MINAEKIFGCDKALIGMVHVPALPGTPNHHQSMDAIVKLVGWVERRKERNPPFSCDCCVNWWV